MPGDLKTSIKTDVSRSVQSPRMLRLRMIGTSRHGQVIEFASPRVTIGSAPHCVLRLRSANVRPVHCLIVRESTGVIVRNLADTLLNGYKFRDDVLCRGDRLQIGPVALEVVDDGFTPCESGESETGAGPPVAADITNDPFCNDESPSVAVVPEQGNVVLPDELIDRILELEQRFHGLVADADELDARPTPTVEPVATVEQLPTIETAKLNDFSEEFVERAAESKRIVAMLDQEHAAHESTKADLSRVQRDTNELRDRCEELLRSRSEADTRLQTLQSNLEQQLSETNASANSLKAEFELRHASVLVETQQLRCELDALKVRCGEAEKARCELERSVEEYQERCQELDQRLQEYSGRLAEAETRLLEAHFEQPAMLADDEPQEPQVNPVPSNRHQQLNWLAQSFAAATSSEPAATPENDTNLADDAATSFVRSDETAVTDRQSSNFDPDADRDDERTHQSSFEEHESREVQSVPEEPEEPRSFHVPLFSERFLANRDDELQQSNEERTSPNPSALDAEPPPSMPQERVEVPSDEHSTPPRPEFPSRAGRPKRGSESDDVFARLSRAGIWKGIEAEAHKVVETGSGHESTAGAPPAIAMLVGQDRSKAEANAEDDSIESYMERLLERVRGDGNPGSEPRGNETVQLSEIASTESKPEPSNTTNSPDSGVMAADEYLPRSQAPEMNANLAAMRELANDSRHTNLRTHAQRKWNVQSQSKFLGALVGLALAVASFSFLDTHTELACAGFLGGCSIAAFWIWRAFHSRRQLLDSLQVDAQSPASESTPPQEAKAPDLKEPVLKEQDLKETDLKEPA